MKKNDLFKKIKKEWVKGTVFYHMGLPPYLAELLYDEAYNNPTFETDYNCDILSRHTKKRLKELIELYESPLYQALREEDETLKI